jgi:sodium transport system permease protein
MKKYNKKVVKTLFKKEILDVIRDKKTVIMMLVIPVILYPLIFVVALGIMSSVQSSLKTRTYNIAIETKLDEGQFYDYVLKQAYSVEKEREKGTTESGSGTSESTEKTTEEKEEKYRINFVDAYSIEDFKTAMQEETLDVYVEVVPDEGDENEEGKEGRVRYVIYYLSSSTNSNYASDIIFDFVEKMNQEMSKDRISDAGLDVELTLNPISYSYKNVASGKQSMGSMLGSVLPFLLIISLLMGTMYPAIDTTAGEKERGTLETLLTLPITNRQMIMGKFLTVAMIGIISALLNILSMGGIAIYIVKIMKSYGGVKMNDVALSEFVPAILVGILAILAFSLFISAVTMCVTSFAKSYKEANNYITPLMLAVLFIGYIGFIPNVSLEGGMALVPVANICLLIKNLLIFKVTLESVAVVLISNVLYAFLAILLLSRIYDSESVLFNDGRGGLQLFEKRSNLKKGGVPTFSDAWFVLLFVIVLVIYLGGILQSEYGVYGVAGTQLIILSIPLVMAIYTKKDLKKTYSLRKPKAVPALGACIFILGIISVGIVITSIVSSIFKESSEASYESLKDIMDNGFVITLLIVALLPAICEEMMFRGYIFAAVREKYRPVVAMIFVAVCFGLYHMSISRLFVTGLLGFGLCMSTYYTKSIFPGMLMHFINNSYSVIAYYYPKAIEKVLPILAVEKLSVKSAVIIAVFGITMLVAGYMILRMSKKKEEAAGA